MARCMRQGTSYKRHQFENKVCKACGEKEVPHVRKQKKASR